MVDVKLLLGLCDYTIQTPGMGNSRSILQLQQEDIEAIQEETGFNNTQIDRLYNRFSNLDKQDKGYLSREDFLRIPELAINSR